MSDRDCFVSGFGVYLHRYYLLFLILFYCQISLYLSQSFNHTNDTISNISSNINNTTWIPLTTSTAFETSYQYYTTSAYLASNDTSRIMITLHFNVDIDSIQIDSALLIELNEILESLLTNAINNEGYEGYRDIIHLELISNENDMNITNPNLYLEWIIIVLIEEDEYMINTLSDYLLSIDFKQQYNDSLDGNIALINIDKLDIYPPLNDITTTYIETTEREDIKYILSKHLREYMLLYVILFCILSITLCCFGGWFCTKKYFANKSNASKVIQDDEDRILNGGSQDTYSNANTKTMDGNKWDEIDTNDAEYMMKAFDDDEALQQNWFKDDSDNANSDEIQMINVYQQNKHDDSLSLNEKLKIHSAFDED